MHIPESSVSLVSEDSNIGLPFNFDNIRALDIPFNSFTQYSSSSLKSTCCI